MWLRPTHLPVLSTPATLDYYNTVWGPVRQCRWRRPASLGYGWGYWRWYRDKPQPCPSLPGQIGLRIELLPHSARPSQHRSIDNPGPAHAVPRQHSDAGTITTPTFPVGCSFAITAMTDAHFQTRFFVRRGKPSGYNHLPSSLQIENSTVCGYYGGPERIACNCTARANRSRQVHGGAAEIARAGPLPGVIFPAEEAADNCGLESKASAAR